MLLAPLSLQRVRNSQFHRAGDELAARNGWRGRAWAVAVDREAANGLVVSFLLWTLVVKFSTAREIT